MTQLSPHEALVKGCELAGGQSAFARAVGCTPGAINQRIRGKQGLSAKFVPAAERLTGIPRHVFAPDIYADDPSETVTSNAEASQ